ncbi:MAG: nucleotidyltransferase domain-containing protein, partial [Thermodesulfobacteriota bacterium]
MELREIVYYICRIKGFSFIGKLAYLFYYRLLSLVFWLTPEIRSLYILGSMASGDVIPGLSDMDFILVIKEMSNEEEYLFLKRLDSKIWYLMPPFGKEKIGTHIFIYSREEWAIFGDLYLGKSFGSARLVFEKENITLKGKYTQFIKGLNQFYKGQY